MILLIGKMTSKNSFTLLELILVVLLLGIIAGFAFPDLSRTYKRYQVRQEADTLAYVMRYAQSRAIVEGGEHNINFSPEGRSYLLQQKDIQSADNSEGGFKSVPGRWGKTVRVLKGVVMNTDNSAVSFYPDGTIDKASITFCRTDSCWIVSTRELSGYVSINAADRNLE